MYLADTHVLLWWYFESNKLSKTAFSLMENSGDVSVSIISFWEIAIKYNTGKLKINIKPEKLFTKVIQDGFELLELGLRPVSLFLQLPDIHRDPFDRMLICQTLAEKGSIITQDENIRKYAVRTKW